MTTAEDRFAAPSYARDLIEAARDNPVPTAFIGAGLLWMAIGGNTTFAFRKLRDLGGTAATGVGAGGRKLAERASSLAANVSEPGLTGFNMASDRVSDLASSAKQPENERSSSAGSAAAASVSRGLGSATRAIGEVTSRAQAAVSNVGSHAGDSAGNFVTVLRESFADLLERQPLVLGALGVAVGAGVAAALPHVAAEDAVTEVFGDLKGSVRDGFVGAYSRAADEARAQGLTLEAASDGVADLGAKVSSIAKGAAHDAGSS